MNRICNLCITAFLLAAPLLSLVSCVPIPLGATFSTKKELNAESFENKKLLAARLETGAIQHQSILHVTLKGHYDITTWESVESEKVKTKRMLALGFAPGLGAQTFSGTVADPPELLAWIIAAPIINGVLLGYPTFGTWFTEAGSEWEAPKIKNPRLNFFSMAGYTKSGSTENVKQFGRTKYSKSNAWKAIDQEVMELSIPEADFLVRFRTDGKGAASFDLSKIPVDPLKRWAAVVRAPNLAVPPKPLVIEILNGKAQTRT